MIRTSRKPGKNWNTLTEKETGGDHEESDRLPGRRLWHFPRPPLKTYDKNDPKRLRILRNIPTGSFTSMQTTPRLKKGGFDEAIDNRRFTKTATAISTHSSTSLNDGQNQKG